MGQNRKEDYVVKSITVSVSLLLFALSFIPLDIDSFELLVILCNKVCRASRNCGRHDCNRVCCELSWQEALKSRGNGKGKNRRPLDGMDGVDVFSIENDPQGSFFSFSIR